MGEGGREGAAAAAAVPGADTAEDAVDGEGLVGADGAFDASIGAVATWTAITRLGQCSGMTPEQSRAWPSPASGERTRSCVESRASPSRSTARGCLRRSPRSSSRRIRFWTRRDRMGRKRPGAAAGPGRSIRRRRRCGSAPDGARPTSYRTEAEVEAQIVQAAAGAGRSEVRVEVFVAGGWGRRELHVGGGFIVLY